MKRYLALLRGINVGGKNKVEMIKLKQAFESVGFSQVSTYINSGNVLFAAPSQKKESLSAIIESILYRRFGFEIRAIVRDEQNIRKLAEAIPSEWRNDAEEKTDILFLWDEYDNRKSLKILKLVDGIDRAIYVSGAIIWNLSRQDYGRSAMNKLIGSSLYRKATIRNVNTVRKLALLMSSKP